MLERFSRALIAMVVAVFATAAGQASAAPIGTAAPIDGYHANSGIERFDSDGEVFAIELMDSPGGDLGEFGIYYDHDHHITLFGADDMDAGQSVMVDLIGGSVMDVDSATFDFFDAQTGDFGFYFAKDGHYVYSEAHLNADLTVPLSIGTYESVRSASNYLITLDFYDETTGQTWAMEAVGGVRPASQGVPTNAVPEPSAAMLFGLGALVMGSAIRSKN